MSNLKLLGEVLACDTTVNMLKLISYKEMYAAEIDQALNMRPSLGMYHRTRLLKLGLIEIIYHSMPSRLKNRKYYKSNADIIMMLEDLVK